MNNRKVSERALGTRIRALSHKHRKIDQMIELEQTRPQPDANLVRELKRERLSLKDSLYAAKRLARQDGSPSLPAA